MLLGLWLARNLNQVRTVMVVGASLLLALSIYLTIDFIHLRQSHPADLEPMLYTASVEWFKPLHICYSVGVDGISVVMLLLSSIIVFTGTFASWQLKPMTKEYFLWFTLLSSGVYGFFICTDMFTMCMFYEVALIPMYLLIGVWGSGAKEYSAMKLTLMLMGGSALLILGIVILQISVVHEDVTILDGLYAVRTGRDVQRESTLRISNNEVLAGIVNLFAVVEFERHTGNRNRGASVIYVARINVICVHPEIEVLRPVAVLVKGDITQLVGTRHLSGIVACYFYGKSVVTIAGAVGTYLIG